jgi:hypothetical protein
VAHPRVRLQADYDTESHLREQDGVWFEEIEPDHQEMDSQNSSRTEDRHSS